ncbi:transposase [Thomasclavelia spiroformis]|uniref:transposase n=2 Tax=Thomasclavelia spiroformis TaxID=29348 RepID=UPI00349E93AF
MKKIVKKKQLIINIQNRWNKLEKKRYKTIAEEFHISSLTAKKYVMMSEKEIQSMDSPKKYKKRRTATDDYINMIYKMLLDGIQPEVVFSYCIKKGYINSWKALDNRIYRLLKNNFGVKLKINWYMKWEYPKKLIIISKKDILKHITSKHQKNKIIEEHINILENKYPVIQEMREIYNDFYETIMGSDCEALDIFISKYKESRLKTLIEGIEKDIAPIKNAISFPQSSGFVEGNNNKFKLIKRILYGRSKIVNLFRKCYLPFLMNNTDFKLMDLLKETKNSTISCTV